MDLQKFQFGQFPSSMVAIRPIGGLGSRMKCIASFSIIATHFQIPLHVYWDTSAGFEKIDYTDLFDNVSKNLVFIDKVSWNILRNQEKRTVKLDEKITYLCKNYMYSDYPLQHFFLTRKPFRMTATCNRDLQKLFSRVLHQFIPTFTTQYTEYVRSFQPHPDIRKIVACGVQEWGSADVDVLGVHIRRNDALQSNISNKFTRPTNKDITGEIHKQLNLSENKHHVFVSTDDPQFFKMITETFSSEDRVHWYPWKHYNHTLTDEKGGQKKALVDMMTLRFCNRIIGTTISVFHELASFKQPRTIALHTYYPKTLQNLTKNNVQQLFIHFDDETEPQLKKTDSAEDAIKTTSKETAKEEERTHNSNNDSENKINEQQSTCDEDKLQRETAIDAKAEVKQVVDEPAQDTEEKEEKEEKEEDATKDPIDAETIPNTHESGTQRTELPTEHDDENTIHSEIEPTTTHIAKPNQIPPTSQLPNQQQSPITDNVSTNQRDQSISKKSLLYLYNANPDPTSLQKQLQILLNIHPNTNSS